jgi:hypothetical protein
MVAVPDFVTSATLVAVMVTVAAAAGAVSMPSAVIVPDEVFHVTALFAAFPCTLAVNCNVPPVPTEADAGDTVTDVMPEGETGAALTVTVADADLVESATLVAVTVADPAFPGAVNSPAAEIDPLEAVQVTAVFVVLPCTVAVNGIVPPVATLAVVGETEIEDTGAGGSGAGFAVAGAAVADNATTTGSELALLISERFPVVLPAIADANATANVLLAPEESVIGVSSPDVLNPVPVTFASLMTSDAEPVLVAVTDCDALPPTAAVTETEFGVTESVALPASADGLGSAEVEMPPTQPDNPNTPTTTVSRNTRIAPRFKPEQFKVRFPD